MDAAGLALLLCAAIGAAGCRSTPASDPVYQPTENVLEVVAVLSLYIDDDTYRFPPARDFAGKNVYRASLARLESLEQIHESKLKSGYLTDVLLFSKGRALERIGEFDLAARHYERVSALESPLAEEALRSMDVCDRLAIAADIRPAPGATPEAAMDTFERRLSLLAKLSGRVQSDHYAVIVREEQERADADAAEYFRARRRLLPGLDAIAVHHYQRLVREHQESRKRNRHILNLGDLYAELARDYTRTVPPLSLDFDPATFDEYTYAATRLYESVAQQDGAIEKIEAARKLEAFLAFTLGVQVEKLPQ